MVNGATNATQKAAEAVVKETYSAIAPQLKKVIKRSSTGKNKTDPPKISRTDGNIDINKLIDGSGIVLD